MMDRITKVINDNLKSELNHGSIRLGKNEKAVFLKFQPALNSYIKRSVDAMIKKLPPNTGVFFDGTVQVIIAPTETIEQKMGFAEAKACVAGQKLVKHQEQTLVLMAGWKDALQEMVELKRQLPAQEVVTE